MMSNVERDRAVDLGISYIFVNKMIMSVLPFANHNNNNIIICTYLLGLFLEKYFISGSAYLISYENLRFKIIIANI